jgi:4-oxalocrotonate tautomerase
LFETRQSSTRNIHQENPMPFAQIYMIEGRTEEQKRAVIEKVSAALVEATGTPIANVRVWIHDVPKENWGIAGVSAKDLGR